MPHLGWGPPRERTLPGQSSLKILYKHSLVFIGVSIPRNNNPHRDSHNHIRPVPALIESGTFSPVGICSGELSCSWNKLMLYTQSKQVGTQMSCHPLWNSLGEIIVPVTAVGGECSSCHSLLAQAGRGKGIKASDPVLQEKKEKWCYSHYPKSSFCNKSGPVQEQLFPVLAAHSLG